MKIRRNEMHANGSVLLVTLLTALIVGIALASYLALVTDQNRSSMRALAWNTCIPVLEAGIEEALSQIHYNGITRPGANHWEALPDGRYYKTRPVGNDGSYYEVSIKPVDPPVIVSVGYVPAPLRSSSTLGMIFGQIVGGSSPQSSPQYVSRRVQVNTIGRAMFSHAMLAKENIVFSGSARTDSFDSTNPLLSTNSKYDPAKARDKGDVASNGTVAKTFMGSATVKIKGHLSTGPGGTASLTKDASVGSLAWHEEGRTGIEQSWFNGQDWFNDDMHIDIPDVEPPFAFGSGSTPIGETLGTNYYNYVIRGGNFNLTQFVLINNQKAIVTGDAVLYVKDKLVLSGTSQIIIAPGASLKIYNAAQAASISGGGVLNEAGTAANFQYFGLPSNTKLALSGTSGFVGAIYAPNADFTLSGGTSDGLVEFTGASVTRTVNMSGGRTFHYDESLGRLPPMDFVVTAWNEF